MRRGEMGTQRRRPKWLEFLIGPGRLASEYVQAHRRKVEEIMTPNPCSVTEEIVRRMMATEISGSYQVLRER